MGFIILFLCSFSAFADSWHGRILEVKSVRDVSFEEMVDVLRGAQIIVLGEKHNLNELQEAQARVIRETVIRSAVSDFLTAWEFLNVSSQSVTAENFSRYQRNEMTALEFLRRTQGSAVNSSYIPILEATRSHGGKLIGVNLSRQEKAPVVEQGLDAADPALIPPGFVMGGDFYFERFVESMGGHGDPGKLQNYFAAQCLTDDVMAYHLLNDVPASLKFLVTGSFHSDYWDGVVRRIRMRASELRVALIRFVDARDYEEKELVQLLHHPRYGEIAEFVYFVNEPSGSLRH